MATAAPISAFRGDMKSSPARKARKKPAIEPSRLLSLLNGNGVLEKYLPKIEAALSPNANMAIAALLAGTGKRSNVSRMPMAKYAGARTSW